MVLESCTLISPVLMSLKRANLARYQVEFDTRLAPAKPSLHEALTSRDLIDILTTVHEAPC